MELKSDNTVVRCPERGTRNIPTKPLTQKEQEYLAEVCWDSCKWAYKSRMVKSGLLSDYESAEDLDAEAYISMRSILSKFDKSKCGPIAEFDVPGADKPKSLEFYFKVYFSGRVNLTAVESREYKKKRGLGPRGHVFDVSYDEESCISSTVNFESVNFILKELSSKDYLFKRFYVQKYFLEISDKELREEFLKQKFDELEKKTIEFHNMLRQKYGETYEK